MSVPVHPGATEPPKAQDRLRCVIQSKANVDKLSDRRAVVDVAIDAFAVEPEAVLSDIHPTHPFEAETYSPGRRRR